VEGCHAVRNIQEKRTKYTVSQKKMSPSYIWDILVRRRPIIQVPRLYSPLDSGRDYSVATVCRVGQTRGVMVSRARSAGALSSCRICKVQYEHIKRDVVGGVCVNCFKFPRICFCQELMISDKDITKIKRVSFFLRLTVYGPCSVIYLLITYLLESSASHDLASVAFNGPWLKEAMHYIVYYITVWLRDSRPTSECYYNVL